MKKPAIITREASKRHVNTLHALPNVSFVAGIIVTLLYLCFDNAAIHFIALIAILILCIVSVVCACKSTSSQSAAMSLSEEHPAGVACRGWFILLNIKENDIHGLFRVFQKGRGTACYMGNMDMTAKLPKRDYFVLENDSMLAVPCGADGTFAVVFHCTGDQAKSWPISVYGDAKIQTVENEGSYRADSIQLRAKLAGS